MPRVAEIEILEDYTHRARLDEGFLRLKRLTARNRRVDGTYSRPYPIDLVDRPTLDAVAVCVWARSGAPGGGIEVLTRRGLRPAAYFRRGRTPVLPEPEYLLVEELIAGVLEPGEVGLAALQRRGADEVHEEAGLAVEPSRLAKLGGPFFPLPGIVSEKIHLLEVEVEKPSIGPSNTYEAPGLGDGSPLEEGALLSWRGLGEALNACESGEIEDAKTELALRRLASRLGVP